MVNKPHNTQWNNNAAPMKPRRNRNWESIVYAEHKHFIDVLKCACDVDFMYACMHAFNSVNIPSIYFHLDPFSFLVTWMVSTMIWSCRYSCCCSNAHCIHCCIRVRCVREPTKTNGICIRKCSECMDLNVNVEWQTTSNAIDRQRRWRPNAMHITHMYALDMPSHLHATTSSHRFNHPIATI